MTSLRPIDDARSSQQFDGQALTCQWCSVPLAAGETRCPTCGSPGIPDPTLNAPGSEILEPVGPADIVTPREELDESWLADSATGAAAPRPVSTESFEDRLLKTVGTLAGAAAICAFIGWLIGPTFLVPVMESITGTPVENPDDLRMMGTTAGLVVGLFIGASIGWILQADR